MASHFRATKDAAIVAMLKREGAIFIVRGNCPQFVFVGHTANRIFGTSVNPYQENRTTGGSSGGDGALVAMRCVPFAIGTDIGGSIRSPASCNGIVGFKPTSQRSSNDGIVVATEGYGMP